MKLIIKDRKDKELAVISVDNNETVSQFKNIMFLEFKKSKRNLYPSRQRYTTSKVRGTPLEDEKKLSDYLLKEGDILYFKDLGAQIDYKLVFVIEYLGPIILWLIGYKMWEWYSGEPKTWIQNLLSILWIAHFVKRELETLLVHQFSHGTMPLFPNVPRNCLHYWGAAVYVGYFVLSPSFQASSSSISIPLVGLWIIFQLGNLYCHIILKNLRPPGTKVRSIPRGFLFEYVSCPNYTTEIFAWICFWSIAQFNWAALLFAVLGTIQMWFWAVKKHKAYRKEFPNYPNGRKVLIPFLL